MKKALRLCLVLALLIALSGSVALNGVLYLSATTSYRDTLAVRMDPTNAVRMESRLAPVRQKSGSRIVFFGDSRIAQWNPLPAIDGVQSVNSGSGGDTTAQGLLRLERDVISLSPDLVVIQLGINDLKAIGVFPDRPKAITQNCEENIRAIVEQLASREIPVLLLTVFPVGPVSVARWPVWSDETLDAVRELNAALATLQGPNVHFFDCDPLLGKDGRTITAYAKDAFHLSKAGYAALNAAVSPEIKDLLDMTKTPGLEHAL